MGDIVLALIQFGERLLWWFLPWTVIMPDTRGYRLTLGNRDTAVKLEAGLVWHWPFAIQTIEQFQYFWTTTDLGVQSLTTFNGVQIQLGGIIKHRILKGDVYLWDLESDEAYLKDIAKGAISDAVATHDWPFTPEVYQSLKAEVKKELQKEEAFSIKSVNVSDRIAGKSLRLFGLHEVAE